MHSGDRLRKRREACKMSLRELSQITGISKATLSRYENNGLDNVPLDKISVIAYKLHTTVSYLTTGQTENEDSENYFSNNLTKNKTKNINENFYRYFDNLDDFLYAADELDRRQNELKSILNKLKIMDKNGILLVDEFINFLLTKEKYRDERIESLVKLLNNINSHTSKED